MEQPADRKVFVRKPMLGRERNSVAIVRGEESLVRSPGDVYATQPVVYQQFVTLPEVRGGKAIVTCFIVDGLSSAVVMRVRSDITDSRARFLPVGIR